MLADLPAGCEVVVVDDASTDETPEVLRSFGERIRVRTMAENAGFGPFAKDLVGVDWPWWAWSLAALALIGILGILRVDLNARIIAVLLLLEIVAVAIYDIVALAHPAGGSWSSARRPRWPS